jgi:hypothetical protein
MDIMDEEIINLWAKFHHLGLKYIMVGGFATNLHGHIRTTEDVDVWIENSLGNRIKLRTALSELNIGDFEAIETMDFIPGWSTIRLDSGIELDIMTYLKGFPQEKFESCFSLASIATIKNIPVPFLHINHLISEKTKVGRDKDKLDVLALEKIKEGRTKSI